MDGRPAELQSRRARGARAALPPRSGRPPGGSGPQRRPSSPTCRARRSASDASRTGPVMWAAGERVRITVEDCIGDHDRVSTTYKNLAEDVRPGDRLLVDDGNVSLIAVEVENGTDVVCDVARGRRGQQQQGPQPARCLGQRAGHVRQGRRRSRVRPAPRRRLRRVVLRAQCRGREAGPQGHGRSRHPHTR